MDTEGLQEFAILESEKAELKNRLDEIDRREEALAGTLKDLMIDAGIKSINIAGRTIFIRTDIWAKTLTSKEELIGALKDSGLGEYISVGVNHQSISAYVRNQLESEEPFPAPLQKHLGHSEVSSLRSKKA